MNLLPIWDKFKLFTTLTRDPFLGAAPIVCLPAQTLGFDQGDNLLEECQSFGITQGSKRFSNCQVLIQFCQKVWSSFYFCLLIKIITQSRKAFFFERPGEFRVFDMGLTIYSIIITIFVGDLSTEKLSYPPSLNSDKLWKVSIFPIRVVPACIGMTSNQCNYCELFFQAKSMYYDLINPSFSASRKLRRL